MSSYVCNLVTLDFLTAFSLLASALASVSSVPTQSFAQNTRIMPPTDWWLRARALPAIQAGARLRLEQEFLLLVLSLKSFGVPSPCSRRVRRRNELGAALSLSLCDRDDHPCPSPFVPSASKSYGENQSKPRKV